MFKFFKKKEKLPDFVLMNCVKNCGHSKCPQWVILHTNKVNDKGETESKPEGRCSVAWLPTVLIDINQSLVRLNETIKAKAEK